MSVVQSSFQAWNIVDLGRGGLVFVNCCCGLITQKILEWCQIQRVHASIVMLEDCLDSVTGKSLQAFVQPWGQEEKVKISQIEIERKRRQWMLSICFMNEATLGLTKENNLKHHAIYSFLHTVLEQQNKFALTSRVRFLGKSKFGCHYLFIFFFGGKIDSGWILQIKI